MDLWIRSQDRTRLIPKPNLYVVESEAGITYIGDTMVGHIGEYATKERALEVLDEIHNFIENDGSEMTMINDNTKIEFTTTTIRKKVYEMPKE